MTYNKTYVHEGDYNKTYVHEGNDYEDKYIGEQKHQCRFCEKMMTSTIEMMLRWYSVKKAGKYFPEPLLHEQACAACAEALSHFNVVDAKIILITQVKFTAEMNLVEKINCASEYIREWQRAHPTEYENMKREALINEL